MSIKDNVRFIADNVKVEATVDGTTGDIAIPAEFWKSTLPEGLTVEDVERVHAHRDNFIAGVNLAVGELGVEATKKNKELQAVSVATEFHKDPLVVKVAKERKSPNPRVKGEFITTHGASSTNYTAVGGQNKAQLKKARQAISELYKELANG